MEQQQIIKKAAKDAEEYMWHYAAQNEADMIQLVKDKGVVFTSPQDEKSDWELKSKTIWPKLYFRVGGQQYVEKIQDIMLR